MQATLDDVAQVFHQHGLRCTRQRRAIFEALRATKLHPTADDLYRSVSPSAPGMSLATIYNTLEALCSAGLAMKLPPAAVGGAGNGNGSARFDATVDDHLHVRDTRTGAVADVPDDLSKAVLDHLPQHVLRQIEQHLGFTIQQVHIELIGEKASA